MCKAALAAGAAHSRRAPTRYWSGGMWRPCFVFSGDETIVTTYCSKKYNPSKEFGIKLDSIPIKLPRLKLIFSKKDKKLPIYSEFIKKIK